ncbi:MAG: NINE protein [Elusimicrobiota bacterium]|jgi:TM2 domain-containing membrane protein YozV|nr:NINE protein [Elusimicrobiota bacterium]
MEIKHYITVDGKTIRIKDRLAAGIIALFIGAIGMHKFYTGKIAWGVVYFIFCWTGLTFIIALIEAILYFFMTDEEFDSKYNA